MDRAIEIDLRSPADRARHESPDRPSGASRVSDTEGRDDADAGAAETGRDRPHRHRAGCHGADGSRAARQRGSQADRRGGVHLRLPDGHELRRLVRVLRRQVRRRSTRRPINQLYNTARVYTPKDTAIVTPNSDTPYSFVCAWTCAPSRSCCAVPEIEKSRYFSVQLVDMYTFNYGYIGSRTTGNGAGMLHDRRPELEGRDARRASTRCSGARRSSRSRSSARSSSTRPTSRT